MITLRQIGLTKAIIRQTLRRKWRWHDKNAWRQRVETLLARPANYTKDELFDLISVFASVHDQCVADEGIAGGFSPLQIYAANKALARKDALWNTVESLPTE